MTKVAVTEDIRRRTISLWKRLIRGGNLSEDVKR